MIVKSCNRFWSKRIRAPRWLPSEIFDFKEPQKENANVPRVSYSEKR